MTFLMFLAGLAALIAGAELLVRGVSTLANFSTMSADVVTVCFPGEYASLKDRLYYDEVIQKLREANEQERAAL